MGLHRLRSFLSLVDRETIRNVIPPVVSTIVSLALLALLPSLVTRAVEGETVLAIVSLALVIVILICAIAQTIGYAKTGAMLTKSVRERAFQTSIRAPLPASVERDTRHLIGKLFNDGALVGSMFSISLGALLSQLLLIAGLLVLTSLHSPSLALFTGAALVFAFLGATLGRARYQRALNHHSEVQGKAIVTASSLAGRIQVIKAFQMEDQAIEKYAASEAALIESSMNRSAGRASMALVALVPIVGALAFIVLPLGGPLRESPTSVIYAVMALIGALSLANTGYSLLEGLFASSRVRFWIEQPKESGGGAFGQPGDSGVHLVFDDISFAYPSSGAGIEHVGFEARPGSLLLIDGPSGSGKSTAASILLGMLQPQAGRLLVDGRTVEPGDVGLLRSLIAWVPQDPMLMDGTIRENLQMGETSRTDAELWEALNLAYLRDWVESLPEMLDTAIGEGGERMSQGQRQRMALARALVRRCPVLLLDEPTAALDGESASNVAETIGTLRDAGETVILISHDPRFREMADQHISIVNGRVLERTAKRPALR